MEKEAALAIINQITYYYPPNPASEAEDLRKIENIIAGVVQESQCISHKTEEDLLKWLTILERSIQELLDKYFGNTP